MNASETKLVAACRALMAELQNYTMMNGADEDDEQAVAMAEQAIDEAAAGSASPRWTEDRVQDLKQLERLVDCAGGLNNGNGIVQRITLCENLARNIRESDLSKPRRSFMQFLHALACGHPGESQ